MYAERSDCTLAASADGRSALAAFRVIRILRLVKLIRLLKASKRLKAWSVKIATPRATLQIVTTLTECLFVFHWGACLLRLVAIVPNSVLDTWLATHGYCSPDYDADVRPYSDSNGTRGAE